jgi:1-phosphofructokinase family hexose kinase
MLLTITPNPALDRTLVIPNLRLGAVHRAERVLAVAGGKGMNVARAAHKLGQPLRLCALLGGRTGQQVAALAFEEGLKGRWSWHSGETRTCVLVVDPQGGDATVLNEQGPNVSANDWHNFVTTIGSLAAEAVTLATISGSLPPNVPPANMATLVQMLTDAGCRVIVDTSGGALEAALNARPFGLKVNAAELSAALGIAIDSREMALQALQELRSRGIALGVVSLGDAGALALGDAGAYLVRPPRLEIVSTVGSGDSLLAGLVTGLLRGDALDAALCLGVACGTADALTIGGGLLHLPDVERIQAAATIEQIAG